MADGDLRRLGDYELLRMLGAGGMGEVHLGVSPTGDLAAVKVIRQQLVSDQTIRERFAAEIEHLKLVYGSRVARLEAADPLGDPAWMAVQYVPGPTVYDRVAAQGPLPVRLVAMVGAMLADGLSRVHQAGVLHRDLKPQNVILGPEGPVLIDFGLAVLAERIHHLTQTGHLIGTPSYMAPEQVRGERILAPSVDVYALGSTLLFAAAGHPPYHGTSSVHSLLLCIADPAVGPDLSGVPGELTGLLAGMMAHEPSDRPALAAVRDTLLTVVGPDVVGARRAVAALSDRDPLSAATDPPSSTRRVPADVPLTLLDPEDGVRRDAATVRDPVGADAPDEPGTSPDTPPGAGDPIAVESVGQPAPEGRDERPTGGSDPASERSRPAGRPGKHPLQPLVAPRDPVRNAWEMLLFVLGGALGWTVMRLLGEGTEAWMIPVGAVLALVFSGRTPRVTVAFAEPTGLRIVAVPHAAFLIPWHHVASMSVQPVERKGEVRTRLTVRTSVLRPVSSGPGQASLTPPAAGDALVSRHHLVTVAEIGMTPPAVAGAIRQASAGLPVTVLPPGVPPVAEQGLRPYPNRTGFLRWRAILAGILAVALVGLTVYVQGRNAPLWEKQMFAAGELASFSPDGRTFAVAGKFSGVQIWDVASRRQSNGVVGQGRVRALSFSPDGTSLAVADEGGIRVFDLRTRQNRLVAKDDAGGGQVAYRPDGKLLAGAVRYGRLGYWRTDTGAKLPGDYDSAPQPDDVLVFSPDGSWLAVDNGTNVLLFDVRSGKGRSLFVNSYPDAVAFSPDSRTLAVVTGDDSVQLWSVGTGAWQRELATSHLVTRVVFEPGGRGVLVAGYDDVERVDVTTGDRSEPFAGSQGPGLDGTDSPNAIALSPDGRTFVAVSDKAIRVWQVR